MKIDTSDYLRLVKSYSNESGSYKKQLHIWLGTGSAASAVMMVTLATNLPDPGYAFRFVAASLWSFLLAVIGSGLSLFFLSLQAGAKATHFAEIHNRDQFNEVINSMPEVFSSPKRLADEANRKRNQLIEKSHVAHDRAERAWTCKQWYTTGWSLSLILAALAFIFGFMWPLFQISFLGRSIVVSATCS